MKLLQYKKKCYWYEDLFCSVQSLSRVQLCDFMDCSMPGFPVYHWLPELTQTHVHEVGDAIQPSHPLSSPSPPAFNLSQHQSLSLWVSSLHHVPKVLELQLSINPYNDYSGLISLRIDWFDLLAVQGTLKSLLQCHNSKASIQRSAFFVVQLSHLFNMLSRTNMQMTPLLWQKVKRNSKASWWK